MGHFAKVIDTQNPRYGQVIQVIVAEPEFMVTFVDPTPGEWIQTSYNTHAGIYYTPNTRTPDPDQSRALRGNYAGVNFIYDRENDVFYDRQPYLSWTISGPDWTWKPPVPYPDDNKLYSWNEATQSWILVE